MTTGYHNQYADHNLVLNKNEQKNQVVFLEKSRIDIIDNKEKIYISPLSFSRCVYIYIDLMNLL